MNDAAPPRRIWLCADDYGMSPGVNRAIRDLIGRGWFLATAERRPSGKCGDQECRWPGSDHMDGSEKPGEPRLPWVLPSGVSAIAASPSYKKSESISRH